MPQPGDEHVYTIVRPRDHDSCMVEFFRLFPLEYKYEELVQVRRGTRAESTLERMQWWPGGRG